MTLNARALPSRVHLTQGALDLALITFAVAIISGFVKIAWRGFTFWGDNAESFFPLWHMYGSALRRGDVFLFDSDGWGAANVVGEAAYGLFNPATALNAIFISFSDRISLSGFIVIVEFLVLLGWGVYVLARTYGAGRSASIMAGVIAPFAGYTLFYEAGNWASGLMSAVWVIHFWWSSRLFAVGRIGPFLPVVLGGFAATVGNPYSVVGIVVVLVAVGVELLLDRNGRRFGGLVVVGLAVGAIVLLTYLPLLSALSQIDRPVDGTVVANTNYLTPTLSDILAMSAPTYLPRYQAWFKVHDLVPSTYLSWLILPLLPWIRWKSLGHWRANASLLVAALVFGLLTLGPDRLWLFRWPIRFVEFFYIALIVMIAIAVSHGFAVHRWRRRLAFSLFAVGIGLYTSWSSTPDLIAIHTAITVVISGLVFTMALIYRRVGMGAVTVVAIIGTAIIAPVQATLFGWSQQDVTPGANQTPPGDLSVVRDAWSSFDDGRVLQIAELDLLEGSDAVASGSLVFGNIGAASGLDIMNRYTGIGFERLKNGLALDYRGSVSDSLALPQLLDPVSSAFPFPVADALGVDTLVVWNSRRDIETLDQFIGWEIVHTDSYRVVLQRQDPLPHPVLSPSEAVSVSGGSEAGNFLSFEVSTLTGGTVLIDRLAWNGYRATLNGEPLVIESAPFGLMVLNVPAGVSGTVEVSYEVPGLALGLISAAAGLLAGVGYQILWWHRRHKTTLRLAPDQRSDEVKISSL